MPVLAILFGLFGVAVVGAMAVYGDRTMRVIVLVALLLGLAFLAWSSTLPKTDITNDPQAPTRTVP